jgi:hypothetical protein
MPPESQNKMELTLRFRGELPAATKSNARVLDKHRIRKDLHNQLAVFWAQHRSLVDINKDLKGLQITKRARGVFDVDRPIIGMKNFFWRYPLCGYDFIPLVTHVHELHCHLDIRVYRRLDQRGILFEGGDLDNRLKTFFDALRVPAEPSQIPEELDTPEMEFHTKEWPHMFCLLDDDKAIKKLSIQSLKMLTPIPENCEHPENYTEMDIDVNITPASSAILPMNPSGAHF